MAKYRSEIPEAPVVALLYANDHTCCICCEKGKTVQIHHLDENPSNHEISNLAVLCLECHNQTQQRGGFGRRLSSVEVKKFREEWQGRVSKRRERADLIISERQAGLSLPEASEGPTKWQQPSELLLISYVQSLPEVRRAAYAIARALWESPTTNDMVEGSIVVADVCEQSWCHLASWFPPRHFGNKPAKDFISGYLSDRHQWHHSLCESEGPGTGGSIVRIHAANGMMVDAENAVVETVCALMMYSDGWNHSQWLAKWNIAARRSLAERLREYLRR